MTITNYAFLDLDCEIKHIKSLNQGGNNFPFIELLGLYPDWACEIWEVRLVYKGKKSRAFQLFVGAELPKPDISTILEFIVSKNHRKLTAPQYIKSNEYTDFFKKFGEKYDIEPVLKSLWSAGIAASGSVIKLIGADEYSCLEEFLKKEHINK